MTAPLKSLRLFVTSSQLVFGPAGTLLILTAFAMVMGLLTQIAYSAHQPYIHASPHAHRGGTITVAIEADHRHRYSAYLPGLGRSQVRLQYHPRKGIHRGLLPVPLTAPKVGYCTLRLLMNGAEVKNIRVPLVERKDEI